MRKPRKAGEEEAPKVPAYIVTFSDMMTLLLTFFVMLLSLSSVQDPELFNMGRGAFFESIRGLGLGMLYGRRPRVDLGSAKTRYFIDDPDESYAGRSFDAREEQVRRIFKKINRSATTLPSQIVEENTNFSVTNVRFSAGEAVLNETAKQFLNEFCLHLSHNSSSMGGSLCVLGLAAEEATDKEQWILSARRAQAVAEHLRQTLSGRAGDQALSKWRIYSWGAGPGGRWVGQDSPISRQSQIAIAVLTSGG